MGKGKPMNDRAALFAAVASAAGEGDDGVERADRYESLLAYLKRHSSR